MNRITLAEFIEEVRGDVSVLRDGHEFGLLIDESNGAGQNMPRILEELAKQSASVALSLDALDDPKQAAQTIAQVNNGEALVLLHIDRLLKPKSYAHLRALVNYHALERWTENETVREMVPFLDKSRFVLVISRDVLEETVNVFSPFWEMIGTTMAIDTVLKEVV
jgi:hypothetical protein